MTVISQKEMPLLVDLRSLKLNFKIGFIVSSNCSCIEKHTQLRETLSLRNPDVTGKHSCIINTDFS